MVKYGTELQILDNLDEHSSLNTLRFYGELMFPLICQVTSLVGYHQVNKLIEKFVNTHD